MTSEKPMSQAGQYYLMEKIAQGGMAEIYKGLSYDVHGLKKTVCIKKILPHLSASKEFIDSLIEEAKLAVKLVHGNIAQTFDLGKVGDDYFMVMEYVDGRTLSQIHKRCQAKGELIPIPYFLYFISEVLSALDYMHRRTDNVGAPLNIVHRDISPQNIMVSYSGTVKIIDFGIAKAAFKGGPTDSGILKGKFAYMSPEQALGDALDQRSDIFSTGIILHEMLTGRRLFKGDDSRKTIRNVRQTKVDPPSAFRGDIPDELDRIVMRALAKDRRHRYPFASEMRDDLVKFLHANYPQFKTSDVTAFVQEIFREDVGHPTPMEANAKTPYLIIDKCNSALADESQFEATGRARAPVDFKEYMIDTEESPPLSDTPSVEEKVPLPEITGIEEVTTPKWRQKITRRRMVIVRGMAIGIAAGVAVLIITGLVRKQPPAGTQKSLAEIMVVTKPADATVSLDGKPAGQGSPVTIKNISALEEHLLEVAKEGHAAHQQRISLKPGEFASVSVTLTPSGQPQAALELITTPPGATVYIDDKETLHRTPVVISHLPIGKEMTIGLYLTGYRFWSKAITLKGGDTKSYDVNLATDFGTLFVESTPPKALVMIDEAPVGQTPFVKDNLEPGKIYKIEIWHEGFKTFTQEIKAASGRNEEIRAVLEPEPKVPEGEIKVKEETGPKQTEPKQIQPKQTETKARGLIETPAPIENTGPGTRDTGPGKPPSP